MAIILLRSSARTDRAGISACTLRNLFGILLNQPKIRLYLPFSLIDLEQQSRKMVNTIWFGFDLIRFRKYFSVCTCSSVKPSERLASSDIRGNQLKLPHPPLWNPSIARGRMVPSSLRGGSTEKGVGLPSPPINEPHRFDLQLPVRISTTIRRTAILRDNRLSASW